jgi:hypothetical protein
MTGIAAVEESLDRQLSSKERSRIRRTDMRLVHPLDSKPGLLGLALGVFERHREPARVWTDTEPSGGEG